VVGPLLAVVALVAAVVAVESQAYWLRQVLVL